MTNADRFSDLRRQKVHYRQRTCRARLDLENGEHKASCLLMLVNESRASSFRSSDLTGRAGVLRGCG
jgi:hypothetical protein